MSFKHGGNITEVAGQYNIDADSIMDFSASINPLGMSPAAKEAVLKAVDSAEHYPDTESRELVAALSEYHSIPSGNILAGNGSTEFIYLIPRVFRPKKALIITPAFSEYERSLKQAGCSVAYFPLDANERFRLDLSKLLLQLSKGYDTLWIGNPNNPTSAVIPREEMVEILAEAGRMEVLVVADEAFMDFSEDESIKGEIINFDNLIVLRSMTKFFALAGLRVGYVLGSKKLINRLQSMKEPWSLNTPGQAAAAASLTDGSYRKESLRFMERERNFLFGGLKSLPFLKPHPSRANFIIARLKNDIKSGSLQKMLLTEHHILVRDCGNFHGLDGEFIRMAVKKREENTLLLKALRSFGG